jgi:hypothetical protein
MDPVVTSAILAAMGVEAVKGLYAALIERIRGKEGPESEVVSQITNLEAKPDAKGRRAAVEEEIAGAGLNDDPELRALAVDLLEELRAQPGGEQRINQYAVGTNIAQADRSSTASVTINHPQM